MNYNELSRDALRLRSTNRKRDSLLRLENNIEDIQKNIAGKEKCIARIARNDYAISLLELANPDYEELKANYEKDNEFLKERIAELQKDIATLAKNQEDTLDTIAKSMDKYQKKFINLIAKVSQINNDKQREEGLKNIIDRIYEDGFTDGVNEPK